MPNHCYNQVTIQSTQKDIENIMEHLRGDETMFDFNNLVPMPELLGEIQAVHQGEDTWYYSRKKWMKQLNGVKDPYLSFPDSDWLKENKIDPFTIKRLENQHGTADWYQWSIANWGTKWNAYDVEYYVGPIPNATNIKEGRQVVYKLATAWAEPRPVIKALMRYLAQPGFDQDLEMRWRFEDELENFNGEIRNGDEEV
jgi:hypothetical protein|tara:strand:+ start:1966 stop:2559 length:594 start_codon:yes stop_codon:yes gene_type:complete